MRYGIIRTERTDGNRKPIHWFRRGTLVRILRDYAADANSCGDLLTETVVPVYGVPVTQWRYSVYRQLVHKADVYELPAFMGPALEIVARAFQRIREAFYIG